MTTESAESAEERRHRAQMFIERLNTQPDVQTALELKQWMSLSPENGREFVRISTLLHEAASADVQMKEPRFRRRAVSAAAGFLALAAPVGETIHMARAQPDWGHPTAQSEAFTLEDKSHIRLYAESQVRTRISEDARFVKLAGNGASFEVKTTPIPFQVRMADLLITATGTEFNVIRRNQDDRTDIYLKVGKLNISGDKVLPLQMDSGDVVKVHDGGKVEKTRADLRRREDKKVRGLTYSQIADAINRENVVFQIEVRGSARSMTAGDSIVDLTDPEVWLRLLEKSGLRVTTPDASLRIVEK